MMQEVAEGKTLPISGAKTKPAIQLPPGNENKPPRAFECRCQGGEIGIAINQERGAMSRGDAPAVFTFDADWRCFHGSTGCGSPGRRRASHKLAAVGSFPRNSPSAANDLK